MSGAVGDWFVCGGSLVGEFLLFNIFRLSRDSMMCIPLLSVCWFLYQV